MCRSGRHIECCRYKNHLCSVIYHHACKLRKTDIKTDHHTHPAKFRIKYRPTVSRSKRIGFFKALTTFYINIKQMCLSVFSNLHSIPVKNITGVVHMTFFIFFRHGTCHQIGIVLFCISRKSCPHRTALFFCILRKFSCLIRTAEHLRQNNKINFLIPYFFQIMSDCLYIFHFIFYCRHLNCRYTKFAHSTYLLLIMFQHFSGKSRNKSGYRIILNQNVFHNFPFITDFKLFLKQNYPRNLSYLSTVFDNLVELYVLYFS